MALMGITEYARHRGCSLTTVQYAIKRGRITRRDDGLVDSEQCDVEWEKNTNHTKARYGPKKKKVEEPAEAPAPPPAANGHVQAGKHRAATAAARRGEVGQDVDLSDAGLPTGPLDFNKARTAKEIYEARIKKLDYEERLGNLVSRKAVEAEAFTMFRILRDTCFNIPDRVSAQIAAETDGTVIYEVLMVELRRAFEEFANRESSPREGAAA